MKNTIALIAVILAFGCLTAQNLERSNRKDRLDVLHSLVESEPEFEKDINFKYKNAETKSKSNTQEAIGELEKIINSWELKGGHTAFSPSDDIRGIIDMYASSLDMVYKLYLINHDYLKAKYTLIKLNGMNDDNKKFPYDNKAHRAKITKEKSIDIEGACYRLFVDVGRNNVGVLFDSAKCDGIKFVNDSLKENNLIRMKIVNKTNADQYPLFKITLLFAGSDDQIIRCWTNKKMEKIDVIKGGRVSFGDIHDSDFVEINSIYQDTVITIKKIIVE